ncbi:uncharacterized protein N7506_008781 [Penicillium brevicompactum]|uniref:uncharacterized protein n=1 Tax=Penicillium brevicompactum TaxID=5074 RepID=UPI0025410F2E|nr:uncharacterized protein N7506_008781 [Penicillium brevicompactum]KAJ5325679.1 hypothetical protein N7506_008781 [Penicillium brevicompactum]
MSPPDTITKLTAEFWRQVSQIASERALEVDAAAAAANTTRRRRPRQRGRSGNGGGKGKQ